MNKLYRTFCVFIMTTFIAYSSLVGANPGDASKNDKVAAANTLHSGNYGVGVTPAIYLVNFMLMYMASPSAAASMPAYRTPIPLELSDCLDENPGGCSYFEYAKYFNERGFSPKQDKRCSLPEVCHTDPKWEVLAPPVATKLEHINQPLGLERAEEIAKSLKMEKSMVLTDREFQCMIGTPEERTDAQQTLLSCIINLGNSSGATNIPLSSYGLAITDPLTNPNSPAGRPAGDVGSLCAPLEPCLEFNELFAGPLERIALQCGWEKKFNQLIFRTPFIRLVEDASPCQESGGSLVGGACTIVPVCK